MNHATARSRARQRPVVQPLVVGAESSVSGPVPAESSDSVVKHTVDHPSMVGRLVTLLLVLVLIVGVRSLVLHSGKDVPLLRLDTEVDGLDVSASEHAGVRFSTQLDERSQGEDLNVPGVSLVEQLELLVLAQDQIDNLPSKHAFIQTFQTAVAKYLQPPSIEEYDRDRVLSGRPSIFANPNDGEARIRSWWKLSSATLRNLPLVPESLSIRTRVRDGAEVNVPDLGGNLLSSRVTINLIEEEAVDNAVRKQSVYEIVFRASPLTQSGKRFDGLVGIWMTWDPGFQTWKMSGVSIYQIPEGEFVVGPFL